MIAETMPSPEVTVDAPEAPTTEPAKPKRARAAQYVSLPLRPWEHDYPLDAQRTIGHQRRELTAAQACIRRQNALIRQLRHELRLRERVMRLKHEAKVDGIAQAIDRLEAERRGE
jgi:hypothetical protein